MYRAGITLIVLLFGLNVAVMGQTLVASGQHSVTLQLPAIALLDIEPAGSSTVNLSLESPVEAGEPLIAGAGSTSNTNWLNYTSAVSEGGASRIITVQITGGIVPAGTAIRLHTGAYSGTGAGILGIPAGTLTLSDTPQTCIISIRGAYTGKGSNNGHRLNYTLDVTDYGLLTGGAPTSLTITYTLIEN